MSPSHAALLIVDMISDWRFEDAESLVGPALAIAPAIKALKGRCRLANVPVIYTNDHHGDWHADFAGIIGRSIERDGPGGKITTTLRPEAEDYFILKPRHSAFYATPLELLLRQLDVNRLILTGVSADQCVLATAADAKTRAMDVWVPSDAVASQSPRRRALALEHIETSLLFETSASDTADVLREYLGHGARTGA
jgi:nicotinamidase-related amidase